MAERERAQVRSRLRPPQERGRDRRMSKRREQARRHRLQGDHMRTFRLALLGAALMTGLAAMPAAAQDMLPAKPIGEGITLDPILAARLRYEAVDQDNISAGADAVTARVRAGFELKSGPIFFLAEGEGTLALVDDFNDTLPGNGVEPFPIVADPDNLEINRLQLGYMKNGTGVTLGRQRIQLD